MVVIAKDRTPYLRFSLALKHLREVQLTQKDLDKTDVQKKSTKILYLNQSYLFHLVALWEKFIEDLALYAFEKLTETANLGVAEPLVKWHFNYFINGMTSPKKDNIDKFFENTLGIENITNAWVWGKMPKNKACDILTNIMDARNEIGHTSYAEEMLSFDKNYDYMRHLINLAFLTENVVEIYLAKKLGKEAPPIDKNVRYPENLVNAKITIKKKVKWYVEKPVS